MMTWPAADLKKIAFHGRVMRLVSLLRHCSHLGQPALRRPRTRRGFATADHSTRMIIPLKMRALGSGALEQSAIAELKRSVADVAQASAHRQHQREESSQVKLSSAPPLKFAKHIPAVPVPADLGAEEYWVYSKESSHPNDRLVVISGGDERGVLYGAFALLRYPATTELAKMQDLNQHPLRGRPAMAVRWTNEWDNANGTVERGYGGRSIFFEDGHVREDLSQVSEYARLLASIGINGCNINNVNGAAPFLTPSGLKVWRALPTPCGRGACALP